MSRRRRGFTLIELMLVVTIIGILSSMAIPSFRKYQFRTKQAERAIITNAIKKSVDDYGVRHDGYPTVSGTSSSLWGSWNPTYPPNQNKRPFDMSRNWDDWKKLNLQIVGNVYHTYYVYGYQDPSYREILIYRYADLDGDTLLNASYDQWWANPQTVSGKTVWVEQLYSYDDYPTTKTY